MEIDAVRGLIAKTVYPMPNSDAQDAKKIADAILSALEAKGMVIEEGWQPIETLPDALKLDGTVILGAIHVPHPQPHDPGHWIRQACKFHNGQLVDTWDHEPFEADYWRPLSEPLASARKGGG